MNTLLLSTQTRAEREIVAGAVLTAVGAGLNRTVYDMEGRESALSLPGKRVRDEGEEDTGDDAADEAFDGLGDTYTFFHDVFDRDSIDGRGLKLDASVHYGKDYLNAFWNGRQMVFGDGDDKIFLRFTRSLDVIAHELSHGVIEHTAALEYHNQPGALNESFADVFGSLVKQYVDDETVDQADWLIGADIIGPEIDGVALRSMKDPGSAYDDEQLGGRDPQPKHMSDYKNLPDTRAGDWGGVHINSGIPNHAFYLTATRLGGHAWGAAGHIWYKTLLALNQRSTFADCAEMTVSIASADFGLNSDEHRAVTESWRDVGVLDAAKSKAAEKAKPPKPRKKKGAAKVEDELKVSLKRLSGALKDVLEALEES